MHMSKSGPRACAKPPAAMSASSHTIDVELPVVVIFKMLRMMGSANRRIAGPSFRMHVSMHPMYNTTVTYREHTHRAQTERQRQTEERHKEGEREAYRETQRNIETERHREGQRDIERDIERDRDREAWRETERHKERDRET